MSGPHSMGKSSPSPETGLQPDLNLEATPRAPPRLRFGPGVCRHLDQALGRMPELIDPVRSPGHRQVRRVFAEPIAALKTIHRLSGQAGHGACAALEAQGLGVRRPVQLLGVPEHLLALPAMCSL